MILVVFNSFIGATSVAFHPDGDFLAIGLNNGVLLILDSKMKKLNYGTYSK